MGKITIPFLKHSIQKINQVNRVKSLLPSGNRLIEPFVGEASVFLNTNFPYYLLADTNVDLINVYKMLAAYQEGFVDLCKSYFSPIYNNLDSYNYYRYVFNNILLPNVSTEKRIKRAILFIYLNRHGFYGLTRYNLKGEFNVPYGHYETPYFPEAEMLAFIAKVNRAELIEFRVADFRETLNLARDKDVIYCDLPNVPLTASIRFTSYYDKKFSWYNQIELYTLCKQLKAQKNITSVVSDHNTTEVVSVCNEFITKKINTFVKQSINCGINKIEVEKMVS